MIRQLYESGAHVRHAGAPEPAATVLWVHGLGESALAFEGMLEEPRLATYRHLAPDLPGYGKSLWTATPRRLEEQAEWLAQWLRESHPEPVVVVGHSMGAVIGLYLCERHPDRVRAFLNVEGNVSLEDCTFSGLISAFDRRDFLEQGRARIFEGIYQDGVEDAALRGYFVSIRLCDPRLLYLHAQELVEISGSETLAGRLAALEIPQLYVLGNPRGTRRYSRSLLERAGIPWRAVEAAGHWPFLDQPERFVDVMVDFLAGLHSE